MAPTKLGQGGKKRPSLGAAAFQEEEEKKRVLTPIEYSEEERAAVADLEKAAVEKARASASAPGALSAETAADIKELIKKIPTRRDELYAEKVRTCVSNTHCVAL